MDLEAKALIERCGEVSFLRDEANWVRSHPAGRVCAHPGCSTVLSIYNPSRHCGAHQPPADMVYNGVAFRLCECGAVITLKSRSGLCRSCSHRPERFTSLRRGGKPDAIQRAQQAARADS